MSKQRAKGTAWESAIVRYLAAEGFPHVERRALNGTQDRGDLAGIPGWVIEAKNCRSMDLAGWVDEVALEQANDGAEFSAVWHHRRGKSSPADGYVTVTGATYVRMLRAMGHGTPLYDTAVPQPVAQAVVQPETALSANLSQDPALVIHPATPGGSDG